MKVLNEIIKNFKIILRNWTSLTLLVIGPLLLILLIGFAFSGSELHDIHLGIVADDPEVAKILNFTQGEAYFFDNPQECIKGIQIKKIHLCLEFSKDFIKTTEDKVIPTGTINFYYDPSEKTLTTPLINGIQQALGLKAEEMSVATAQTIFGKIQLLAVFLTDARKDTDGMVEEAKKMRQDLVKRRDFLINISNEFNPAYYRIKELEQYVENDTLIRYDAESLKQQIQQTNDYIDYSISANNILNNNILNSSLNINNSQTNEVLYNIKAKLNGIDSSLNQTVTKIEETRKNILDIIDELDKIKLYLDLEINETEKNIGKIDNAIQRINVVKETLDKNLVELAKLKPEISEDLINPISLHVKPLLEKTNVYLLFPTILTTIIIFISMLFSNIVTLTEINSTAYFRSFIVPVKRSVFVAGIFLTNMIILLFQISILFFVGQTNFSIDITNYIGDIMFITMVVVALFSIIGMIVAYLFRSQQTSILITTFTTLIIFLMSNAVIPLEIMPKIAYIAASFNPFVLAQRAFAKILMFGSYTYINELAILISYLLFAVAVLLLLGLRERNIN